MAEKFDPTHKMGDFFDLTLQVHFGMLEKKITLSILGIIVSDVFGIS